MEKHTTGIFYIEEQVELKLSITYRYQYLPLKDEVQVCDVEAVIRGKSEDDIIDQVEALIKKQFNADVDFLDKITLIFKS